MDEISAKIAARSCSIERSPYKDEINFLLQTGTSLNGIEKQMRSAGHPVKRETVKRHLDECLNGKAENLVDPEEFVYRQVGRKATTVVERDFAVAIQKQALAELAKGTLRVTTKDGLLAQQLLDKRAEKAKDREFIMNLARLVSGAGAPPPDTVIEGEFNELVDEMAGLLAPPEVRVE